MSSRSTRAKAEAISGWLAARCSAGPRRAQPPQPESAPEDTASAQTKNLDFSGFDSSIFLFRGVDFP